MSAWNHAHAISAIGGTLAAVLLAALGIVAAVWFASQRHRPWCRGNRPKDGWGRRRVLISLTLGPSATGMARGNESVNAALTRIQLHNTSRDVVVAGFISPMFGLSMRQGDIPAGQNPQFTLADGRPCPATLWGISSWPDGSMKFCGAMVRVPAEIPSRGVVDVLIRRGDEAPTASKRSLDELAAFGLAVELTGVDGLEGVWTAALADGIRERTAVVRIGDGDAGTIWRIGTEFRDSQGKAHGQLYCWHYVAALQDTDGRLRGLRHLGRVAQPWVDVTTPAPRHRDVRARLLAGKTELRRLQGHVDTETVGDTIRLPHYASFFTAGEDARWDDVQMPGGGADNGTVRVSLDPSYLVRTRLVPPYDLKTPLRYANAVDHHPMGRGTVVRGMGMTGERDDIGVFPEWNVRHLIGLDPSFERVARVNAMSSAGWRFAMRKRSTGQPIPCVEIRPRYAGLGPVESRWRGYSYATGIAKPSPNDSLWKEDTAHRPGCIYWPYLATGEPQYLDLMVEQGFGHVLELAIGTSTYATKPPIDKLYVDGWKGSRGVRIGMDGVDHPGAGVLFNGGGGKRVPAWASRDVAQAAAICPDTAPDGAAVRDYLRDVMHEAYAALSDYARLMPRTLTDAGMFVLGENNESPWMLAYMSWSVCHQADVLATPESIGAREYLSRFWRTYAAVADIGGMTAYRASFWSDKGMVTRVEDVVSLRPGKLLFSAATGRGTVMEDAGKPALAWRPSEGDVFVFGAPETSPLLPSPEVQPRQRMHAVDCKDYSFQLARTSGGTPIQIPKDIEIPSYMCRARDLRPAVHSPGNPYNYASNVRGAVTYHLLRNDDVGQAKEALDRIVDAQRIRYDDRCKYLLVAK